MHLQEVLHRGYTFVCFRFYANVLGLLATLWQLLHGEGTDNLPKNLLEGAEGYWQPIGTFLRE